MHFLQHISAHSHTCRHIAIMLFGYMDNLEVTSTELLQQSALTSGYSGFSFPKSGCVQTFGPNLFFFQFLSFDFFSVGLMAYASGQK